MSYSKDQCANCLSDVGASLAKNEYNRRICSRCAGTTASTTKSSAVSLNGVTGPHSPAIQALSKLVSEGKADALDIVTKIKAGTSPEFLAANEGRDMGEAVLAAMDAEHPVHKPLPKIETRTQAVAEIKAFEANKDDMGDQVVASMLRDQFRIYEELS